MSSLLKRRELWRVQRRALRAQAKALGLLPRKRTGIKVKRPKRRLDKALAAYWPDWIARA
jgi:hypothetical protein